MKIPEKTCQRCGKLYLGIGPRDLCLHCWNIVTGNAPA